MPRRRHVPQPAVTSCNGVSGRSQSAPTNVSTPGHSGSPAGTSCPGGSPPARPRRIAAASAVRKIGLHAGRLQRCVSRTGAQRRARKSLSVRSPGTGARSASACFRSVPGSALSKRRGCADRRRRPSCPRAQTRGEHPASSARRSHGRRGRPGQRFRAAQHGGTGAGAPAYSGFPASVTGGDLRLAGRAVADELVGGQGPVEPVLITGSSPRNRTRSPASRRPRRAARA